MSWAQIGSRARNSGHHPDGKVLAAAPDVEPEARGNITTSSLVGQVSATFSNKFLAPQDGVADAVSLAAIWTIILSGAGISRATSWLRSPKPSKDRSDLFHSSTGRGANSAAG